MNGLKMGVSEDWQSSPIYGVPVQGNFVGKDDDKTVGLGCTLFRQTLDLPKEFWCSHWEIHYLGNL